MAHGEYSLIEIGDVLPEFGCIFEVRQDRICSFASHTCSSQAILRRGVEVDSTTIPEHPIRHCFGLNSSDSSANPDQKTTAAKRTFRQSICHLGVLVACQSLPTAIIFSANHLPDPDQPKRSFHHDNGQNIPGTNGSCIDADAMEYVEPFFFHALSTEGAGIGDVQWAHQWKSKVYSACQRETLVERLRTPRVSRCRTH